MRGIFKLRVKNKDGLIVCEKTIPNTVTASGLAQIGSDGFSSAAGVSYTSISSSAGAYKNYDIYLGDRNSAAETDHVVYKWGHFTNYNPVLKILATGSAYKIKWIHQDIAGSAQYLVADVPGSYGSIGLRNGETILMHKNIPGTNIGPFVIDTTPPPHGTVSASGSYTLSTGSDYMDMSHLYPHMDYAVQTRDGPASVGVATYVWWKRPHLWEHGGNWEGTTYQKGYRWNLSTATTGPDLIVTDILEGNPDGGSLAEIAASLTPDHSSSTHYPSGRIYITYEGDSTEDGRAAYLDTGSWSWIDITHATADSGAKFRNAVIDGNGDLWVASDVHSYKWTESSETWSKKTLGGSPASGTTSCYQVALNPDNDDVYFMSTDLDYLYRFQTADSTPSNVYYLNLDATYFDGGRSQLSVYNKQMWVDSSGTTLWLGVDTTAGSPNDGGVFKIGLSDPEANTTHFHTSSGLVDGRVTDIVLDSDDNVWVMHGPAAAVGATTGIEKIDNVTDTVISYGSDDGFVNGGNYYTAAVNSNHNLITFLEEDIAAGRVTTYYLNRSDGMAVGIYESETEPGASYILADDARGHGIFMGQYVYWMVRTSANQIGMQRHPVRVYYGWNGSSWGQWNTDSSGSGSLYGPRVTASGSHELDNNVWVWFNNDPNNDPDFNTGINYLSYCGDGVTKSESQTMDLTYSFYTANAHFNEVESGNIPGSPLYEVTLNAVASGSFLGVDGEDSDDITVTVSGVPGTLVSASGNVDTAGEYWVDNERGTIVFDSSDADSPYQATFTWLSRD